MLSRGMGVSILQIQGKMMRGKLSSLELRAATDGDGDYPKGRSAQDPYMSPNPHLYSKSPKSFILDTLDPEVVPEKASSSVRLTDY